MVMQSLFGLILSQQRYIFSWRSFWSWILHLQHLKILGLSLWCLCIYKGRILKQWLPLSFWNIWKWQKKYTLFMLATRFRSDNHSVHAHRLWKKMDFRLTLRLYTRSSKKWSFKQLIRYNYLWNCRRRAHNSHCYRSCHMQKEKEKNCKSTAISTIR